MAKYRKLGRTSDQRKSVSGDISPGKRDGSILETLSTDVRRRTDAAPLSEIP